MKINYISILKYMFTILLVLFIALYISQSTGYYAYNNYKKSVLTEEGIKNFEQDVADGKKIDINNYIKKENDYNNNISSLGLKISTTISKYVKKGIVGIFNKINKLIE